MFWNYVCGPFTELIITSLPLHVVCKLYPFSEVCNKSIFKLILYKCFHDISKSNLPLINYLVLWSPAFSHLWKKKRRRNIVWELGTGNCWRSHWTLWSKWKGRICIRVWILYLFHYSWSSKYCLVAIFVCGFFVCLWIFVLSCSLIWRTTQKQSFQP